MCSPFVPPAARFERANDSPLLTTGDAGGYLATRG